MALAIQTLVIILYIYILSCIIPTVLPRIILSLAQGRSYGEPRSKLLHNAHSFRNIEEVTEAEVIPLLMLYFSKTIREHMLSRMKKAVFNAF